MLYKILSRLLIISHTNEGCSHGQRWTAGGNTVKNHDDTSKTRGVLIHRNCVDANGFAYTVYLVLAWHLSKTFTIPYI